MNELPKKLTDVATWQSLNETQRRSLEQDLINTFRSTGPSRTEQARQAVEAQEDSNNTAPRRKRRRKTTAEKKNGVPESGNILPRTEEHLSGENPLTKPPSSWPQAGPILVEDMLVRLVVDGEELVDCMEIAKDTKTGVVLSRAGVEVIISPNGGINSSIQIQPLDPSTSLGE